MLKKWKKPVFFTIWPFLEICRPKPRKAENWGYLWIYPILMKFIKKKIDEPIAVLDLKFDLFDNYSEVKLFVKVKFVIIIHIRHMWRHSTSLFSRTVETVIFELLGVINVIGPIFANFGLNHCLNLDMIQRSLEILTWASWEPN